MSSPDETYMGVSHKTENKARQADYLCREPFSVRFRAVGLQTPLDTAQYLAEKTGKTTIITEKTSVSYSGGGLFKRKNISKQQEEKQRNLLDPSECMQLPGAEKDQEGKVTKPGDMLIFCAGSPAIYGEQILYFKDPEFIKRKKIPCPEMSDKITREQK